MGRLIGYMANRTDRIAEALSEERQALGLTTTDVDGDAWGIGFYQGGEVLHKKRPRASMPDGAAPEEKLDWNEIAGNVRSDCAIVHFRTATVGDYRAENTHPFRMRQWLFAHSGTVFGFETLRDAILEPMPDFLRRNIRGTTDSEHIFHSLLSFLHDRGQLDNPEIDDKYVLGALRSTVALIDRLVSEIGAPEATLNLLLTNGRSMYGVRRGTPMHYVVRDHSHQERGSSFRYALVVANGDEGPPDYKELGNGEIVVVSRALAIQTTHL